SVIYCFSYFLHLNVSKMYAGHEELLGYLEALADKFRLHEHIAYSHAVNSAVCDDEARHWVISCENGKTFRSRTLIPGWGQLGTPFIPQIDGLDTFAGDSFHSARWQHDIDLRGKRVASIGAAASAVQYVPEIAPEVEHLTIFQRSANYILPRGQYAFTDAELERFETDPDTSRQLRTQIHNEREEGFARTLVDSAESQVGIELARQHLEAQVLDPQLRQKLTPNYQYGCKRILRSDDYYPVFNRENVALDTSSISHIVPEGIVTRDGALHALDVIIFGTGFESQAFHGDIVIQGRAGVSLDERWGNSPEAFLGMSVDQFPNLFMIYGPNTNLNHHSIVAMIEAQNEYIVQAVQYLRNGDTDFLEVDPQTLERFITKVQTDLERSAYASDCSSWYKNSEGRVINNWSGTVREYHDLTAQFSLADYRVAVGA